MWATLRVIKLFSYSSKRRAIDVYQLLDISQTPITENHSHVIQNIQQLNNFEEMEQINAVSFRYAQALLSCFRLDCRPRNAQNSVNDHDDQMTL